MSRTPTDWTIWLPKAFFLDWSDRTKWERHLSDPTIWFPLGIFPQEVREGIVNNYYYNISKTQGNIIGVGQITGSTFGQNVVVGSGTINVSQQELSKIPVSEYANALKEFSESVNQQLKGRQISEEKVNEINNNLNELAKEVQDIKPGEEQEIDYVKQTNVEAKTAGVIQKVLDVLPEAAETAATFTPLAPFSKLIGKGVQGIVDAIAKRRK